MFSKASAIKSITILIILAALVSCVSSGKLKEAQAETAACNQNLESTKALLAANSEQLNELETEKQDLDRECARLKAEIVKLEEDYQVQHQLAVDSLTNTINDLKTVKDRVIRTMDERMALKDRTLAELNRKKLLLEAQLDSLANIGSD